jgi:hypothetical protein
VQMCSLLAWTPACVQLSASIRPTARCRPSPVFTFNLVIFSFRVLPTRETASIAKLCSAHLVETSYGAGNLSRGWSLQPGSRLIYLNREETAWRHFGNMFQESPGRLTGGCKQIRVLSATETVAASTKVIVQV